MDLIINFINCFAGSFQTRFTKFKTKTKSMAIHALVYKVCILHLNVYNIKVIKIKPTEFDNSVQYVYCLTWINQISM